MPPRALQRLGAVMARRLRGPAGSQPQLNVMQVTGLSSASRSEGPEGASPPPPDGDDGRPPPRPRRARGKDAPDASKSSLRALANAIDAYFAAAPREAAAVDGMDEADRALLAGLREGLAAELGDPAAAARPTLNAAPPGRLPWEVLGVDEEHGVVHWAADLTEGRGAPDAWRNARLSREAKQLMAELHAADPAANSVEALARQFRVRRQRVAAVLALRRAEADAEAAGRVPPEAAELEGLMEDVWGAREACGSGERHAVALPSRPNYRELGVAEVASRLEAALGKPVSEVRGEDLTPELARRVLGVRGRAEVEAEVAAREEAGMVAEFERALAFNAAAAGAPRTSRARAPRRPPGGWPLVVKPAGGRPYAAEPDGARRELAPPERVLLERQTPRPAAPRTVM